MSNSITAIVLAAGMGVRMKSQKPKVLHAAAGRSLLGHVIAGLSAAGVKHVRTVVGHGGEQVKQHLWGKPGIEFFTQEKQLGTADAVKSAQVASLVGTVIICNGDHPLITADDYRAALDDFNKSRCDLLFVSASLRNPAGLGRVVRDKKGTLVRIIEEKDASAEQKKIHEVNSGLYVAKAEVLRDLLPLIENKNAKKEFYLTDIIPLALGKKKKVMVSRAASPRVVRGVNNQAELALAAKVLYRRKARQLLEDGVTLIDPATTYVDADVTVGSDTVIGPGCFLTAGTSIGSGCNIEAYCHVRASKIDSRVEIRWGTLIDQSEVHEGAVIGPYARLRPESIVEKEAHVGNFVEMKKARLGVRSKANHLTYLGDAEIGENTNIGCGTITCNYATDRKKYKTKIGKNVFVGSDTQFIAPVTIGDGAVIGSGSTITKDVPSRALAVARGKQFIKPDYNKE